MRDQVTSGISGSGRWGSLSLASRRRNFEPKPGFEGDGLRQALFARDMSHEMTTISQPIRDQSSPARIKKDRTFRSHQDGGDKYATGVTTSKIRVRNNITISNYWHLERENLADGRQIGRIVI